MKTTQTALSLKALSLLLTFMLCIGMFGGITSFASDPNAAFTPGKNSVTENGVTATATVESIATPGTTATGGTTATAGTTADVKVAFTGTSQKSGTFKVGITSVTLGAGVPETQDLVVLSNQTGFADKTFQLTLDEKNVEDLELTFTFIPRGTPFARYGQLQVAGGKLRDSSGNVVQLKGMSTHGLQWNVGRWILQEAAFDALANDWELDLIRLAMYVGEGGYASNPREILDRVEWGIVEATKRGMYVMVDWHVHAPGDPNDPVYLNAGLSAANMPSEFNAIKNANPSWTGPQVFFAYIAQKYGSQGNVLYETANEPHGLGSQANRFTVWSNILKPYHESVIQAIRTYDSTGVVVCGTDNWSQFVDSPAHDPISDPNVMYVMHFYSGTHDAGDGPASQYVTDQYNNNPPYGTMGEYWLRKMADNAIANGLAIFATEWGISEATGDGGPYVNWAKRWVDYMEENDISWSAWSLTNKMEISGAFQSIAGINYDASGAPLAPWSDMERTVAGNFYRAMIRGEDVPMYAGRHIITDLEEGSMFFEPQEDNANDKLVIERDRIEGEAVAKFSNLDGWDWANRVILQEFDITIGGFQDLEFDVYLEASQVDTGSGAAAFDVIPILQDPAGNRWWLPLSGITLNQNAFASVPGTNLVKAGVSASLAPAIESPDSTAGRVILVFWPSVASDVWIGNVAFTFEHNGDISNFPTDDRGVFVSLPFTFESGTREGWARDTEGVVQNEDLSIGTAESQALMFPITFVPGDREWAEGARLSSPHWPEDALPLGTARDIEAVTLEVFLEAGAATTGYLEMAVMPVPAGAGYWHDAGRVRIDPVSGETARATSGLRKYTVSVPFTIADYSEEVRPRNIVLALYNAGDSDYSGNVYYDNIGFALKDGQQLPPYRPSTSSRPSGGSSGGGGGGATTQSAWLESGQVPATIITNAQGQQIARTRSSGQFGVRGSAWQSLAGKPYQHDTIDGNVVQVRLYIDEPGLFTKDTLVSAYVKGSKVDSTQNKFEKFFDNTIRIVSFDQQEEWEQPVRIAAKVDLAGMDTENLHFYHYDKATNTYKLIPADTYRIDANGYLHFTTPYAGDIIITDSPLQKK